MRINNAFLPDTVGPPRDFLDCLLIDLVDDTGEPDGDERWRIQQYFKIWKAEGRSTR